ncbi:hypothetical protein ACFO3O_05150 [Dokdonia ponticola]|uniref:Uncharacterized protein n=1 Tax=Dokdonia ponticola TaxID=2041041 RepID=A0ABV9HTX1_9FLAO
MGMYRLHHIKQRLLTMLLLASLCFTFSYEVQAHTTRTEIALVDTQIHTKNSGVAYMPLVQQAKKADYFPFFVAFSFQHLVYAQDHMIAHRISSQKKNPNTKQRTVVIDYLQQHTILSDDTDTSHLRVIRS